MDKRKPAWKSRKWWAALIGVIVPLLNHYCGLDMSVEDIYAIVVPIVAYILGESHVDARK
ncbi:MAG: hypothetical protein JRD89_04955 [Deltaproteobacteria bacterium]|nr:hypothetical protein [Deltaproteobacteria bacterium]